MTRKICIVTGTRAEYGLLRRVMQGVRTSADLTLQIVATGMHLSPEFGATYKEIEQDGFVIDAKVEMLLSADTKSGTVKSLGIGVMGMSDALEHLKPDLLVVLGDRFEILAAVSAALIFGIPVAHIHGGETTEGAFDEAIRHSVTKMSHLHFVAAEDYRKRVIQLGEQPDSVFLVGGLGVDAAKAVTTLDRASLEKALGFSLGSRSLLATFHPVTLENGDTAAQMNELLAALDTLTDTQVVFTMPNADTGGREIMQLIDKFVASHPNTRAYTSLGQKLYLSCLKHVDGVIGNSSSGLLEAPTFGVGTINIGDRQRGRLKAQSVIDCEPKKAAIIAAIKKLTSTDFQAMLSQKVKNPYGDGGASKKIVSILRSHPLESVLKKSFFNLTDGGAIPPAQPHE